MGTTRRFLNLVVSNGVPGVRSLCRIDLTNQPLFHPPNVSPSKKMEMIPLPGPSFNFKALAAPDEQPKMDCFPLPDNKLICSDHLGRSFHFDGQARVATSIPSLHKPKSKPLSLFVPANNTDADDYGDLSSLYLPHPNDADSNVSGTLFVMERIPDPEVACRDKYSHQFEAFVYGRRNRMNPSFSYIKSWKCELLPPPPFVRDPKYCHRSPEIISYATLEGGSRICISVKGVGTYFMDTTSHTWEHVGDWMLPFYGKVDYVPELNLWFGLSAVDQHLAAADLSNMESQSQPPQLVSSVCKEFEPPEEWKECKDSQVISLGFGKFCIARFFCSRTANDNLGDQNFAVFTGVEVVPLVQDANTSFSANVNGGSGKVKVKMIPHISRCHDSNGTAINALL